MMRVAHVMSANCLLWAWFDWGSVAIWATLVTATAGCGSKPARVSVPQFDPPKMAAAALEKNDSNHDGSLSGDELKSAPGLRASLRSVDKNQDGKIDQSEIEQHLESYSLARIGLQSLTCMVTVNGAPVGDAVVDFIPEEFLAEALKPARAVTGATGSGPVLPVDGGLPGIAPGIYRVTISKRNGERELMPAKYNSATELGFEVSSASGGAPAKFDLSTK
jgi:hypothetical protein